jgi:hypothetical protein
MTEPNPADFIEERKIIDKVLDEICPIEAQLLGASTLDDILAGAEFGPVRGGRHFELGTAISLVSCICSLTQLAIKTRELKRAGKSPAASTSVAASEHEVHVALSEQIAQDPHIARVLSEHSVSPARVVQTIDVVLKTNSLPTDRAK